MPDTIELPERRVLVHARPELCFQVVAAAGDTLEEREDGSKVVAFEFEAGRRTVRTREVVRLDPPRSIDYAWLEGPLPEVTERIDVVPLDGGDTELRYRGRFRLRPHPLNFLARHVVRRRFDRAVRRHLADAKVIAERRASRTRLFPRTGA